MFENVGAGEILLILIFVLIFFGPKKIPELAQSLGKGLKKFNDAKQGFETQMKTAMKEPLEAMESARKNFESKLDETTKSLNDAAKPTSPPPARQVPQLHHRRFCLEGIRSRRHAGHASSLLGMKPSRGARRDQ